MTSRIDRSGARTELTDPLAPEMLGLVQHAKAYELLAIKAATSGDRRTALRALLTNPWSAITGPPGRSSTRSWSEPSFLPRFFPEG